MTASPRIPEAARRGWILAAMGCALGIVLLDEVLVGVALPTIREELGLSEVLTRWVVNAYVLAIAAFVATTGRLGDILGHRQVFIGGGAALCLGSLGAGLADSATVMLTSRAVEGLGAATMISLSIAMTGIAFGDHERGEAIGRYGLIAAVLAAISPLLGGVLVDLVSWRGIFLLNVPLMLALMVVVAIFWRDVESIAARPRLDLAGLSALLAFVVPLVIALMEAPARGWGSAEIVVLFAISAAGLVLFISIERRVRDPLINPELLRPPTVVGANAVIFCAQFSKIAVLVFGTLLLQDRLGLSPLGAGVALLAAMVPQVAMSITSGRLTDRLGPRRPMLGGVAVMVVALLWLAVFSSQDRYVLLLPGLLLFGASISFFFNPGYTTILSAVAAGQRGEASGVTSTCRQLGGALAVAVLGAVQASTGGFGAVFAVAAGITVAVWFIGYLLIDRRPALDAATDAAAAAPARAR
jgi:EmrB/QacA subfamily drug resistance transporter